MSPSDYRDTTEEEEEVEPSSDGEPDASDWDESSNATGAVEDTHSAGHHADTAPTESNSAADAAVNSEPGEGGETSAEEWDGPSRDTSKRNGTNHGAAAAAEWDEATGVDRKQDGERSADAASGDPLANGLTTTSDTPERVDDATETDQTDRTNAPESRDQPQQGGEDSGDRSPESSEGTEDSRSGEIDEGGTDSRGEGVAEDRTARDERDPESREQPEASEGIEGTQARVDTQSASYDERRANLEKKEVDEDDFPSNRVAAAELHADQTDTGHAPQDLELADGPGDLNQDATEDKSDGIVTGEHSDQPSPPGFEGRDEADADDLPREYEEVDEEIAELNDEARETLPIEHVDFKDFDPSLAREVTDNLSDLTSRYPEVDGIHWVSTIQERNDALSERGIDLDEPSPNVYAQASGEPFGEQAGVAYNREWSGDYAALHDSLSADVESGYHPPGTDQPAALLTHEFGHMIDFCLEGEGLRDEFLEPVLDGIVADGYDGVKNNVSEYAASRDDMETVKREVVAECFAEYVHSEQPRPAARSIGNAIDSAFARLREASES